MPEARYAFTPPTHPALRWLAAPGHKVSPRIGRALLGEIFASPLSIVMGVINGLIVNVVALCLHSGRIFLIFMLVDVTLNALRLAVVRRAVRAATRGTPTATDLYLLTGGAWCALQGAMAFTAMRTGVVPLQLLAATMATALTGPICARNYAAPRYALMLVSFCIIPLVAGAAMSGDRWLLAILLQTPPFMAGVAMTLRRFQNMAIANLEAHEDSCHRARHDSLTGLLNRFGLMEALDAHYAALPQFVLFYLDLDGFKPINDNFGHQAGDRILQAVAERLKASIRAGDIVSRLGGDEFVIVVPNMSPSDGERLAERIIHCIANEPYLLDTIGPLRIGISVGLACAPDDGSAIHDLHAKADAALYEAKAAGKGIHRRFSATTNSVPPVALGKPVFAGVLSARSAG